MIIFLVLQRFLNDLHDADTIYLRAKVYLASVPLSVQYRTELQHKQYHRILRRKRCKPTISLGHFDNEFMQSEAMYTAVYHSQNNVTIVLYRENHLAHRSSAAWF